MDTRTVRLADASNIWHHLTRHTGRPGPVMVRGEGLRLWDLDGREYLDATSGGVWCVNVGYGRREIADRVAAQLSLMPYYAGSAGNVPSAEFSERLLKYAPHHSRLYFSSSGSEANEKAYKMARLLSALKGGDGTVILYRDRDYHGTTLGALSSSGQSERRDGFGPFVPGFEEVPSAHCYRCAFGLARRSCSLECAAAVEEAVVRLGPGRVGGAVFETVTAGGGVIVPPEGYWPEVAAILKRHGALLILDEVVTGMGRTGAMFAFEHYGIAPDIVTLAKGVASAYMPLSVTLTTEEVFRGLQEGEGSFGYFRDISTFGGSAAAAAAADENLAVIEREGLVDRARVMGGELLAALSEAYAHPAVGDVRGLGLLCGVELVASRESREPLPEDRVAAVVARMAELGVLAGRTNRSIPGGNNVINFAPAYTVTGDDVETIRGTLMRALADVLGS
ncbi:MAG: aminotransferase class III-fold pyridoxal phosphate-dependent enzyme [Deltaproteobacteria bacterium]|jgi:taurine-pyruvate aminotransferase|nr:aminotransferase class III-fold pyridoxal phosphate-dependent enzyme [Deltaproteobacteria bacterium]